MKNIFKALILLVAGTMFLTSCHKDLDITYGMTLNSTTMWKDPSDLEQSVPGIYERLRNYFKADECNVFYLGEIRVGDYMWGPSLESLVQDNFKINCRKNRLSGSQTIGWSGLYSTIDQANAVIKYADKCHATPEKVKWALAQAYFARAYCYFWAGRIWGYCPINLLPVESNKQEECYPKQHTPAEVFAQVEEDLKECEALADALGTSKYLGTREALKMLEAEYALWMYRVQKGDKTKYLGMAKTALESIGISDKGLLTNYADVFNRTNKVNKEIVFALNNTATSAAGYQIYFCFPANLVQAAHQCNNGGEVPISATQWWSFSQTFVDVLKASEKAGDSRVATNLGYGPFASAADHHEITWCNKLLGDMSKAPIVRDNDLIYYRYALAVMMYAEVCYYNEDFIGAVAALNIIAKRAYGTEKYTSIVKADVLQALTDEYFLEFPAEGVIWFALIRLGQLEKYNPDIAPIKAKNPNYLLWPIAQGSINKNPENLKQVEGWY